MKLFGGAGYMIINIQFMKKRWNPENIGGWGLLSQLPKKPHVQSITNVY